MAKRRKSSWMNRLLQQVIRFFVPKQIRSKMGWFWFGSTRLGTSLVGGFLALVMLFSVLPVPYSAYILQQKVYHLFASERYDIQKKWVSLDQIAWQMQMAVIASEDQTFESHFGIDLNAIQRALIRNGKSKKVVGASTISQQTVKNMFLWHGQSWIRKGIELPMTLVVENVWGKARILEVYLNVAEFGDGIFGVEAAARHFFNKSANQLSLQEAALLAASLPNPQVYRVNKPGPTMRKRQAWIMRQVNNLGGKNYLEKL